jgi:transposase-like protein
MRRGYLLKEYIRCVWSAVNVDFKKLLTLEALYGRRYLNALLFLKKALSMCTDKPLVRVLDIHRL